MKFSMEMVKKILSKKSIGLFVLCASVVILMGGVLAKLAPDPWDVNYDPMRFRLESISWPKEFAQFARVHLPVGTPRQVIDKILVEKNGMNVREWDVEDLKRETRGRLISAYADPHLENLPIKTMVNYSKGTSFGEFFLSGGWQINALYDANDRLLQIEISNLLVFPDQPAETKVQ